VTSPPRRKRIRLDHEAYTEIGSVASVTIACFNRTPFFRDPAIARAVIEALKQRAGATGVRVHAYCLMPDHCHLLCSPSEMSDLVSFIGGFKSLSRNQSNAVGANGPIWQRSFFDHMLRREEDLKTVVRYVLANPVRAKLVDDWREYPFCGSLTLDVSDL
jgi:REP element-mobilizing transposase RayT